MQLICRLATCISKYLLATADYSGQCATNYWDHPPLSMSNHTNNFLAWHSCSSLCELIMPCLLTGDGLISAVAKAVNLACLACYSCHVIAVSDWRTLPPSLHVLAQFCHPPCRYQHTLIHWSTGCQTIIMTQMVKLSSALPLLNVFLIFLGLLVVCYSQVLFEFLYYMHACLCMLPNIADQNHQS